MYNLQTSIAEKFLQSLSESKEVDADAIEHLRALLADGNKPKADDFVKIFTTPADEEVK